MRILRYACSFICLFVAGCTAPPPPTPPAYYFEPPTRQISYLDDVEPVLVKRCVVCHSCYNSPCQLKLSSWDGLERGASKEKIYNASRLKTMDPSRLLVDAHSQAEWRQKGFFGVTQVEGAKSYDQSMLYRLLDHKRIYPGVKGEYYPEASDLTCAETEKELQNYLNKHPNNGMPFGFPPLKQEEFNTIIGWLSQGARGPTPEQQAALRAIPVKDQKMVDMWELFLNNPDPKYQMTARYLYEHLFLAHLSFETGTNAFYELVRSRTGPGEDIDVIATVRPYDDPGVQIFYYRFRKIYSTIVYKTHMVYPFDRKQYQRVNELFTAPRWVQEPHLVGYDQQISANPFETFAQIPARSRYQWLLDHTRYVTMTYIRGPVCKGQIALNVINDQFWLLFLDPEYDLSIKFPGFLRLHNELLRMPIERGSSYKLLKVLLDNPHYKWAIDYYQARQNFYAVHYPEGLGVEAIWKGNLATDEPVLTVFRHFDSASVHRGVLGNLPKTVWVMDYPLLERIYYALVAGFDIYGTAGHQLSIRLYMDALRIEGESYFLDFMPQERRQEMIQSWYAGVMPDKLHYYDAPIPAGFPFRTEDPKREFLEEVIRNHITAKDIGFDQNYLPAGLSYPELPAKYEKVEDFLQGFVSVSAPGVSFFRHVGDHNANVAWVRIKNIPGIGDKVVSVVIDRWHDNVKFIIEENLRLDPNKDRADFISGFVGSYPNYFYVVDVTDLPDFFDILDNYDGSDEYLQKMSKYGVNRADERFWEVYDWFQNEFDKQEKERPGLIDLNRYFYLAKDGAE